MAHNESVPMSDSDEAAVTALALVRPGFTAAIGFQEYLASLRKATIDSKLGPAVDKLNRIPTEAVRTKTINDFVAAVNAAVP